MSFLNLRISGRLYVGFGALLLFCIGLAGFAVMQLGELRTQVAAMTLQSENTIRVGEIATNLQAIRRAILRYAFDHDEKSYTESETRLKKAGDLLDAKLTGGPSPKSDVRPIRRSTRISKQLKAKRLALGEAVHQLVAGRDAAVHRRRQDGGGCSKIRRRRSKNRFRLGCNRRSRPRCFWFASRTGGCWRPVTPRGSRPSRPTPKKPRRRSRFSRRRICRQTSRRC